MLRPQLDVSVTWNTHTHNTKEIYLGPRINRCVLTPACEIKQALRCCPERLELEKQTSIMVIFYHLSRYFQRLFFN